MGSLTHTTPKPVKQISQLPTHITQQRSSGGWVEQLQFSPIFESSNSRGCGDFHKTNFGCYRHFASAKRDETNNWLSLIKTGHWGCREIGD
jgi:hypothetical protein